MWNDVLRLYHKIGHFAPSSPPLVLSLSVKILFLGSNLLWQSDANSQLTC